MNGMDIFDVIKKGSEAAEYIRSGKGPILVEAQTYRYRGHSMSDPATYRTKEELNEMKHKDPLAGILHYMEKNKVAADDEVKKIENLVKAKVNEAVEFAKNSPEPDESELLTEIYN